MPDSLTKLEQFALLLLHQSAFTERGDLRSWKGYDWDIMNRLHEAGLITNPVGKAKSVFLTDEGRERAEALALEYLGPSEGRMPSTEHSCECGCGEPSPGTDFRPGHDQKLRGHLETRVGGLLALRRLIDAATAYAEGHSTTEELTQEVRGIFGERE